MGIISYFKKNNKAFTNKSRWESALKGVDFMLARDEIAYIFHIGIEEAKKNDEVLIAKKEVVAVWEKFFSNPCLKNAIKLLEIAPFFLDIFEKCKPGGYYRGIQNPSVNKLAKTILNAANYCAESLKKELKSNLYDKKERDEKYIHIYFEFIYFFMHLTNRIVFNIAGNDVRSRFTAYFGNFMAELSIESIIGHWPQELKDKIRDSFFENLNDAELEYSTSKSLLWNKDNPLDGIIGDSLLAKLTRNIAANCGYEMSEYSPGIKVINNFADMTIFQIKIAELFIYVRKNIQLESVIEGAAKSI